MALKIQENKDKEPKCLRDNEQGKLNSEAVVQVAGSDMKLKHAVPSGEVDRYGFYTTDKRHIKMYATNSSILNKQIWLENNRTKKWVFMVGPQFEKWDICQKDMPHKLKKRIRKGIPEALRGKVWGSLLGSIKMMDYNPGMYRSYLAKKMGPCDETISRDIGRTFPKHYLFESEKSLGQTALFNVLRAYALHDPAVGYCQGMGFIAAMFLSYIPEESTFWYLVACMNNNKYELADLFRPGMPKVQEVVSIFEIFLQKHLPKLFIHFQQENIHPTMYASQWFITLFTYNFPFSFVTRVWDIFIHEGWKIIYRCALALLKMNEKKLLQMKFEEIMECCRDLPSQVQEDKVLELAFSIPIKRMEIERLKASYKISIQGKSYLK